MSNIAANKHPLADSYTKPFERSRVSGAQFYLVLTIIVTTFGVALAYLLHF